MSLQRNLTQADLDANPILPELQGVVGDIVSIYHPDQDVELVPEVVADVVAAEDTQPTVATPESTATSTNEPATDQPAPTE